MSSSSSFIKDVFEVTTWPGRVLIDHGRVLLRNSQSCRIPPIAYMGGAVLSLTGFVAREAGEGVAVGVITAASLYNWALGSRESDPEKTDPSFIENERRRENIETDGLHIAVCGQTGSGKSSVTNALRGIKNNQAGAAATGTTETTTRRATFTAHERFSPITLHDIPGGGTRRTPAANYYDSQKLFLFDLLLVVHSERLGEIDIDVIKACIHNRQPFLVVRSKSDISINNTVNDHDLDLETAKMRHINTALAALRTEFEAAGVPRDSVEDIVRQCILVNNRSLRRCVLGEADSVINELELVRFLGRLAAGFLQNKMEANP